MIDFSSVGAWFDQAGKDIDQGGQDFGETALDGAQVVGEVMNEIANGDVMQGITKFQDDASQGFNDAPQVIYDLLHPDNPDQNWVVNQIETTIETTGDSRTWIDQQPRPDYIAGPDFNDPAPVLPLPGFKTFDPLTNPNIIFGGDDFELVAAGVEAEGIYNNTGSDGFDSDRPDPNSADDQVETTINQQPIPDYSTNNVATNDVNYSRESDVLTNFNSTEADLGIDSFTTASGLKITDHVAGIGVEASSGQIMEVHYRGMLEDGTQFDASYDRGTFTFPLGAGRVISGWEEGIAGMKVGGKRTLEIPPVLGYGARGAGGVIPPNATLIFEVELIAVDGNRNVTSLVTTDAMFETYDPLTNPNPGLEGSGPEFGEVGIDALSIDSTNEADFTNIEDLQGLVAGGGYDSIESMNESPLDSLIFQVADVPMF